METYTLAVLPVSPDFRSPLDEREEKRVSHGVHCPSLKMERVSSQKSGVSW